MPLWTGRFKKSLDKKTNDFNSSIPFDCRMAQQDIKGSVAHATMLGKQGIIDKNESEKIVASLKEIAKDIEEGSLEIDMTAGPHSGRLRQGERRPGFPRQAYA